MVGCVGDPNSSTLGHGPPMTVFKVIHSNNGAQWQADRQQLAGSRAPWLLIRFPSHPPILVLSGEVVELAVPKKQPEG